MQISGETKWKLNRIVRGQNSAKGDELTVPANIDALAENILAEWITTNHAQLDGLYEQREAIDQQAVEAVKRKQAGTVVPF